MHDPIWYSAASFVVMLGRYMHKDWPSWYSNVLYDRRAVGNAKAKLEDSAANLRMLKR